MKLKDWSDKVGVKYLTAYRWFKAGKLPVYAYQTDSGTILVEDDAEEDKSATSDTSSTFSLFIKKTIEYSANQASIEDFAAYILSNFTLKLIGSEVPKYSKNKPKSEEVQKHFKKFLPSNVEKPAPCNFIPEPEVWEHITDNINDKFVDTNVLVGSSQGLVNQIHASDEGALVSDSGTGVLKNSSLNVEDLQKAIATYVDSPKLTFFANGSSSSVITGEAITNADLNPQNYTYSTNSLSSSSGNSSFNLSSDSPVLVNLYNSLQKADELSLNNKPKRGRPKKKGV